MLSPSALRRVVPSLVLSFPLLLAAPGTARAQVVHSVSPALGTVGTLVSISGTGLMESQPKVFLECIDAETGDVSKHALKLVSLTDELLVAQVNKAQPGPCTLHVTWRKNKEASAAFEIKPPEITGVTPASAAPGEQVTLTGNFFGSKVVRVRLLDRRAKVVSSSDSSVVFIVPKRGLPDGTFTPQLSNPIGMDWADASIVVSGSSASWPADFVSAELDGQPFLAEGAQITALFVSAKLAFDAYQAVPSTGQISLLLPFNSVSTKIPKSYSGSGFGSLPLFVQLAPAGAGDSGLAFYGVKPGVQPWSVLIVAKGGNHVAGVMQATLQRVSGSGPDTITLSDGRFLVTP